MAPPCARCCIAQHAHTGEPVARGTSDSSSPGLYPDESFPGIIAGLPLPRPIWASPKRACHCLTSPRHCYTGTQCALTRPYSGAHQRFPWIYRQACPCHGLSGQALLNRSFSLTPRHEDRPCQDNSHGQGSTPGHAAPSSLGWPRDWRLARHTAPPMRRNSGLAGQPNG